MRGRWPTARGAPGSHHLVAHPETGEDFQGARLNRQGPGLVNPVESPIHHPDSRTNGGQLSGGKTPPGGTLDAPTRPAPDPNARGPSPCGLERISSSGTRRPLALPLGRPDLRRGPGKVGRAGLSPTGRPSCRSCRQPLFGGIHER
ncbi:hypothetical protein SAMN04489832_1466 [Micromonospora cremea]|uniref:Uncharacterized protein n=1 Tax=Micromonospora cremea TaxID=709881 RepID=A0A1N5VBC4_9ACTN|nr:hypothetical protein SAMN04489832_1466 [Micromonospora cremea]